VTNKIQNRLLDVWSTVPWLTKAAQPQDPAADPASSESTAPEAAAGALPGKQEAKPRGAAPDEPGDGGN
jgi:hypothetical protein